MLEDVYKATDNLKLFHQFKYRLPIEQRNINNIKSLPELAILVDQFKEKTPEMMTKSENKKAAFVKSFENYDLYIPKTYEQSRDLGRNTEWCTAADSDNGRNMFNRYNMEDKLYILLNKYEPSMKLQLHFVKMEFMDEFDRRINLIALMDRNPDIKEYFMPLMGEDLKYFNFESFKEETIPQFSQYVFFTKDDEVVMLYETNTYRLYLDREKLWIPLERYNGFVSPVVTNTPLNSFISEKMLEIFNIKHCIPVSFSKNMCNHYDNMLRAYKEGKTIITENKENTKFIYNHINKTNPHTGERDAFAGIPSLYSYDWNIEPKFIYPDDKKINHEMLYPASKIDVKKYKKLYEKGHDFPEIVLYDDGKHYHVFDGAHRLKAAIELGVPIKAFIGVKKVL